MVPWLVAHVQGAARHLQDREAEGMRTTPSTVKQLVIQLRYCLFQRSG